MEPLLDNLLETHAKSGGVSWRVFANYVAKCSSVVYLGAEIGYTAYPETRYSQGLTGIPLISEFFNFTYKVKSRGWGVDALMNLSLYVSSEFCFSIRPGFQFAHQKNIVVSELDIAVEGFDLPANAKYQQNEFLPEIILSGAWTFLDFRKHRITNFNLVLTLEATYQHVFGNNDTGVNKHINSRDLLGISFGLSF